MVKMADPLPLWLRINIFEPKLIFERFVTQKIEVFCSNEKFLINLINKASTASLERVAHAHAQKPTVNLVDLTGQSETALFPREKTNEGARGLKGRPPILFRWIRDIMSQIHSTMISDSELFGEANLAILSWELGI